MGYRKNSILTLLDEKTKFYHDRTALSIKDHYGWKELSYKGVSLLSKRLASYLIDDLQVKKGEKCAILSESKPEYGACLFASIISGMTAVPLDIKLTIYELTSILSDCLPSIMLVSEHYIKTAIELQKSIPSIKKIILIDEHCKIDGIETIYDLPERYETRWVPRSANSTAVIVYTSGTTGAPKGVETSFKNIMSQLEDLTEVLPKLIGKKEVNILSILPMNHLFEMTVGFSTFLNMGYSVYYTRSLKPKDILSIMKEKRINFMIVVPAFLKLLKTGIESDLAKESKRKQFMFKLMYFLAKFVPFKCIKKLMFRDIHNRFGGHFLGCMSGGAPLDINVGKFFERVGIKVAQGYGLSETSPVISVNYDKRKVIASVGKALPHFEARIDKETGELQVKGPSVMKGYHNQPELTAQTIDEDGWLHTGDIAEMDKDGHIYITGRIKNLIVLSGGKKVFPEEVEAVLDKSKYLAESCVFGHTRNTGVKDGTEAIVAVVVPEEELYNQYNEEEVEKMVKKDLKQLCTQLTPYKRPIDIIVSREALPRTATKKVKRKEVKELMPV